MNKAGFREFNKGTKTNDRFLKHWMLFEKYKQNRNQPVRFLSKNGNARTILQYIQDSVDRMNEFGLKPAHKKDWQNNIFEPITRNKLVAILSRIVSTKLQVGLDVTCKNLVDITEVEDRNMIYSDLLTAANEKNNDDHMRVWEAYIALSEGTVFGYESWKKDAREVEYVKEIDPDTGETKTEKVSINAFDDVYGEIIPINEVYPETIWESNFNDNVNRVFWVKEMTMQKFHDTYGRFKNANKVKSAGDYTNLDNFEWGISKDVDKENVEVIHFYDEVADKMGIWANGVEIYYGCLPWNHKRKPIWHAIGEPIHRQFLYGKSIADKLMSMQDLNNALFNAILDQLFISLNSPIFVSGEIDNFDDGYLEPARIYTMEQGAQIQKGTLGAVDPNAFNVLQLIKRSVEASSASDQSQGIATGGRKTRYEVEVLQEGAMAVAGLSINLLENALKRKYWLRMKNILQYYTMPISVESGKPRFKFIVLDDRRLTNNKTGKRIIDIIGDEQDAMPMADMMSNAAVMEGTETYDPSQSRIQPIQITRDWLISDRFDFDITIIPFSSIKDTEVDRQNKDIAFYQMTAQDPHFDQEMNRKDFARAFKKDPRIVKPKEEVEADMAQQQQGQPEADGLPDDPMAGLPGLDNDLM